MKITFNSILIFCTKREREQLIVWSAIFFITIFRSTHFAPAGSKERSTPNGVGLSDVVPLESRGPVLAGLPFLHPLLPRGGRPRQGALPQDGGRWNETAEASEAKERTKKRRRATKPHKIVICLSPPSGPQPDRLRLHLRQGRRLRFRTI